MSENRYICVAKKGGKKSRSKRAGITFPVAHIYETLKKGYFRRVGAEAPVYMAAVLEYLTSEILKKAARAAIENGKTRINPRQIMLAIRLDDELNELLKGVIISQAGVPKHIDPQLLLSKRTRFKKNTPQND